MKDYTLKGCMRRQSEMSRYALNLEHRLSWYDTELTKAKKRIWELKDLLDYEKSISDQKQNEINLKYREVIALQERIEKLKKKNAELTETCHAWFNHMKDREKDLLAEIQNRDVKIAELQRE